MNYQVCLSQLTPQEQYIVKNASLMRHSQMRIPRFLQVIGREHEDALVELIGRGILRDNDCDSLCRPDCPLEGDVKEYLPMLRDVFRFRFHSWNRTLALLQRMEEALTDEEGLLGPFLEMPL